MPVSGAQRRDKLGGELMNEIGCSRCLQPLNTLSSINYSNIKNISVSWLADAVQMPTQRNAIAMNFRVQGSKFHIENFCGF